MDEEMITISTQVDKEMKDKLDKLTEKEDRSLSAIMRISLKRYIDESE